MIKDRMSMSRHSAATHTRAKQISKKLLVRAIKGLPYYDFWSYVSSWLRGILRALDERTANVMTTPSRRT
jgi:hypothetical protein